MMGNQNSVEPKNISHDIVPTKKNKPIPRIGLYMLVLKYTDNGSLYGIELYLIQHM